LGLGYIGLPTASLLATKGLKVTGVDVNPRVVARINEGRIHIHEPDLEVLVRSAVNSGNLTASPRPEASDVFIIAVPTPLGEDHTPDLTYVESATEAIAPYLEPRNLIVLESTSPVGTTESIAETIRRLRPDLGVPSRDSNHPAEPDQIFVAHCPERVLPGRILRELVDNDRIVGGIDPASARKAATFYEAFASGEIVMTDSRTAEFAKLVENAFRDVNIAFANELSIICDALSIDVWELIELANRHPRVNVLKPGPGVGGHCIAVDPWFIVHAAPETSNLIRAAREVNDSKPIRVVEAIRARADRFHEPVIACLGLSYKADIDDLRESPAVRIVQALAEGTGTVLSVEPYIEELPERLKNQGVQLVSLDEALTRADIVVGLVDHKAFLEIESGRLQDKIVIDTRGIWR
jgi:UDP-N-acetyl-D-mannosaminuronic acid dehydrogenase